MMQNLIRKRWGLFSLVLLAVLTFNPLTAMAIDLKEAKANGLVGEQANGYLGTVQSSSEVMQLIERVNKARKSNYNEIALRNKTTVDVVEKLAGKKAIDLTPAGQYVKPPSGSWMKK